MAGHVKHAVMWALWAGSTWSLPVCAMGPSEPFVAPAVQQARTQLGQGTPGVAAPGDALVVTGLSGVRLGRQAGAVIDGQWVRKGHMVRGARLVQIQRTRVTLQHPDGHQEIIEMYPPVGGQAGAVAAASTEAAKP
ncbi:MAG: hypothetical protein ACM3VZ_10615 [Acidobacteriota bacterium]